MKINGGLRMPGDVGAKMPESDSAASPCYRWLENGEAMEPGDEFATRNKAYLPHFRTRLRVLCTFEYKGELKTTVVPAIAEVQQGFWVNDRFQFTHIDIAIWIPPSRVHFVVKG